MNDSLEAGLGFGDLEVNFDIYRYYKIVVGIKLLFNFARIHLQRYCRNGQ